MNFRPREGGLFCQSKHNIWSSRGREKGKALPVQNEPSWKAQNGSFGTARGRENGSSKYDFSIAKDQNIQESLCSMEFKKVQTLLKHTKFGIGNARIRAGNTKIITVFGRSQFAKLRSCNPALLIGNAAC